VNDLEKVTQMAYAQVAVYGECSAEVMSLKLIGMLVQELVALVTVLKLHLNY